MAKLVPKTLGELSPQKKGAKGASVRAVGAGDAHSSAGEPAKMAGATRDSKHISVREGAKVHGAHDAAHTGAHDSKHSSAGGAAKEAATHATLHATGAHAMAHSGREPVLHVAWTERRAHLVDDLRALFSGPRGVKLPRRMRFHDPWTPRRYMAVYVSLSALVHVLVIALPLPLWLAAYSTGVHDLRPPQDVELTWSGPIKDLPALGAKSAAPRAPERKSAPEPAPAAIPQPNAETAPPNPPSPRIDRAARQTIVATPARPNHPRQMLIQPETAPEAPKLLPSLPNIVQWGRATQPARPRMPISREALARLRPKNRARRALVEEAAPALPNQELRAGALSISSNAPVIPKPAMPLPAASVPLAAERRALGENAAPELPPDFAAAAAAAGITGGDNSGRRIIALSADPAPPPPSLDLPGGNLSARVAVSPLGPMPGPDAGVMGATGRAAANGNDAGGIGSGGASGSNGAGSGGAGGPQDIFISRGDPAKTANIAGPGEGGSGSASGIAGSRLGSGAGAPGANPPRISARDLAAGSGLPRTGLPGPPTGGLLGEYAPQRPEEAVLRQKRVYSISVNMPNLTSVTGSWIVKFAELDAEGKRAAPVGELSAPEPIRKVDPKYPPALIEARIEGDVILYAIIRKDGTVDSVQVLRSLESQLDRNAAEAFTRWQFWPAIRSGTPVDLEAVVTIPFRAFARR